MIIPLVLLVDHGVVSEGEHSKPTDQKRRSDNGNLNNFYNNIIFQFQSVYVHLNLIIVSCASIFIVSFYKVARA